MKRVAQFDIRLGEVNMIPDFGTNSFSLYIGGNTNRIVIRGGKIFYKDHDITLALAEFIDNGNLDVLLPPITDMKQ